MAILWEKRSDPGVERCFPQPRLNPNTVLRGPESAPPTVCEAGMDSYRLYESTSLGRAPQAAHILLARYLQPPLGHTVRAEAS
jgi:hypothetical protein